MLENTSRVSITPINIATDHLNIDKTSQLWLTGLNILTRLDVTPSALRTITTFLFILLEFAGHQN